MKRKSKILCLLIIFVMVSTLVIAGCAKDEAKVLKIGMAPYDNETPNVEIIKQIATEQGYEVKVVDGDIGFMFMSMAQGDVDVWTGLWLPSIHRTYHEKYGDQYEVGSAIYEDAPLGWVVPNYVDIDSIADLVGNEDVVNGKLVGIEPGAGMMMGSEEVIEGYGLDIEIVAGSTASMIAELDYAITHQEPILFLGWRPLAMMTKYDVKILEDPKGYWQFDSAYLGIRHGLEEQAPDMYNLFQNFKMSLDDTEEFIYEHQEKGKDAEDLAKKWIEKHRSEIDSWLEG